MYNQGDGNLCSTWSYVISFCSTTHEAAKFALNSISPSVFLMVISPPRLRQFVREMPLLVVLLSLLMKLQFIKKKKKGDVQPYCIKALIVLKLLFFCSNSMLPIYKVVIQILCVCVCVLPIYRGSHSDFVCMCVCVLPIYRGFHSDYMCVCSFENIIVGKFKNIAIGNLKNIAIENK